MPAHFVAPLVGAWIEIIMRYKLIHKSCVAPLVGAWIEIISFHLCIRIITVSLLL